MSAIGNPAPPPVALPPEPAPVIERDTTGRRSWWIWLVAAAIAGAAAVAYQLWLKPAREAPALAVRTAKATRGLLERTLRVSGLTTAGNFANMTAPELHGPESGKFLVILKLVPAGSMVHKGQVIATFDAQSTADHVDDVEDTVRQAEADVRKRKAEQAVEWETTLQTNRASKAAWDKAVEDARASDVKTDIEREELRLAVDEAAARYKQQEQDLANRKIFYAAEIRILELTIRRHHLHLDRHKKDLERFVVYAPMDGIAVMQPIFRGGEMGQIQEGDQIYPDQPFMKIVDPKSMRVEANANQAETGLLRLGQSVRIGLDAFPGVTFSGKLEAIGALAVSGWRQNAYIRKVPLRCSIVEKDSRLIPDLSAYADIIVERAADVVRVPLGAIRRENGKTYVMAKGASGFERRDVTLGLANEIDAAVTEGLQPGDEVRLD